MNELCLKGRIADYRQFLNIYSMALIESQHKTVIAVLPAHKGKGEAVRPAFYGHLQIIGLEVYEFVAFRSDKFHRCAPHNTIVADYSQYDLKPISS